MPSHSMNGTVNTQAQGNPCRSPMAAMTAGHVHRLGCDQRRILAEDQF